MVDEFNILNLFCLSLLLSGCIGDGSVQAETPRTALQAYNELVSLHAEAPCTTTNHCTALPVGSKACGGPGGYIPISTLSTNMDKAISLAIENRAIAAKDMQGSSSVSDCSIVTAPSLQCVAEKCVLGPLPSPVMPVPAA